MNTKQKLDRNEVQAYVTDYWETMSKDEQELAVAEGFTAPNTACVLITVDFVTGLGEIGREWI